MSGKAKVVLSRDDGGWRCYDLPSGAVLKFAKLPVKPGAAGSERLDMKPWTVCRRVEGEDQFLAAGSTQFTRSELEAEIQHLRDAKAPPKYATAHEDQLALFDVKQD